MEVKAVAKNVRMSAKKVRLVADVIRGNSVNDALQQLMFVNKRAVGPVQKVLQSAVSNAKHNFSLDQDKLYIKEIKVDEAFTIKRWMPRAFGRATPIRKRNSHITVVVAEVGAPSTEKKEEKPEAKKEVAKKETKKAAPKKEAKKSEK